MTIFTDTSALVALFNPKDPTHKRAKKLSSKYEIKSFIITEYIFAETVTVLSQRVGKDKAILAGELLIKRGIKVQFNQEMLELSWGIFKKQTSKNVSFVDCTSFALYHKKIFDIAFTFDIDFKLNKIPILE